MSDNKQHLADGRVRLREMAETQAGGRVSTSDQGPATLSAELIEELLHNLRVHQIELEIQNEELRRGLVERDAAQARLERVRWQAASAGFDAESRSRLLSSQDEFITAEAELASLDEELGRYTPKAPFAGHLRDLDPDLQVGQWLARKEKIAVLVGNQGHIVETWLSEDEIRRVEVGNTGIFMADGHEGPVLRLTVSNVDADATRVLVNSQSSNPAAGQLAAQSGGHILTRERNGQLIPEQAMYRVVFKVDSPTGALANQAWRGRVVVHASWEAPAGRYLRSALSVLVREAGF